jgi:Response regulator containing CheY-like receiver, AAA-type ATPase, and DNA-binding domains
MKHVLERAVILSEGKYIRRDDMVVEELHKPKTQLKNQLGSDLLTTSKEHLESTYILGVLKACRWNRTEAANRIGISRRTLYNKIVKFNLSMEDQESME